MQVFNVSLKKSMPDTHLPKRLNNIINTLTLNVYNYACTGMYVQYVTLYISSLFVGTIDTINYMDMKRR